MKKIRLFIGSVVLLSTALAALPSNAQRALGIDSPFKFAVNWEEAASNGIQFACIKATQGITSANAAFVGDMESAKAAGIYVLPYHRCEPSLNSPATEAEYFWNFAGSEITAGDFSLSPALDVEDFGNGTIVGASSYAAWCNDWYNDVASYAEASGIHLNQLIYINTGVSCDFGNDDMSAYLWIAAPCCPSDFATGNPWDCGGCSVSDAPQSCRPTGGDYWQIWQYSWTGTVPGVSDTVDLDVYNGTISQMVGALGTSAINTKPVALTLTNGAVSAFFISSTNGSVQTDWQVTSGGTWNGPAIVGANGTGFASISGVLLTNGTMAMYGCGGGAAYTSWQGTAGGPWSNWVSLGGSGLTKIKAFLFPDGRVGLASCGDSAVYYQEQTSPGGSWTGWSAIPDSDSNTELDAVVAASGPSSNCATVFASGGGPIWTASQTTPHGSWSGWTNLSGTGFETFKTLLFKDGHMAVVGCGFTAGGGAAYYQEQNSAGSDWTGIWTDIAGSSGVTEVNGLVTTNQLASVFVCGGGGVWTSWQSTAGGSFSSWVEVTGTGTGFQSLGTALPFNDQMVLLGCGSGSHPNFSQQTSVGGSWSAWDALGGTVR
jgi:lysozyme